VYVSPGSPINKVIGIGFDGTLDPPELDALESAWRERREPVRIELCSLTDPQLAHTLSQRGYQLHGFENVLARSLAIAELDETQAPIAISVVSDDRDFQTWKDISVTAFTSMDGTGSVVDDPMEREQMESVLTEMTSAPGFRRYLARMNGEAVGAASLRIDHGLAQMAGAGTLPQARGKGVQKALLQARLIAAKAAGCDLAVVTTAPGSRSQENMMRRGFALLYARAVMIKAWD
jgi:ribosomal protein S18 acetylase RimI-like enzyme